MLFCIMYLHYNHNSEMKKISDNLKYVDYA